MYFEVRAFSFYDIFDNLQTFFWHCFLLRFFIDFGRCFGSILEPFGIKKHDIFCVGFSMIF